MAGVSGAEIIALAAVIVSGVVGLATLTFNFWNSSSERKYRCDEHAEDAREWYRRTLFERRIEALQEAQRWMQVFWHAFHTPIEPHGHELVTSETFQWYTRNVIYIHGEMPEDSPVTRYFYGLQWSLMLGELPRGKAYREAEEFLQREANTLLEGIKANA